MLFPTFFNLKLNLPISSSLLEPQSAPSLVVADSLELFHHIRNLISVLAVWWCTCVESSLVGRGSLPWPGHSIGKTLLGCALFHSVLQGQISLLLQVSLDFLLWHSSPLWWKEHLLWVLVLEGLIGLWICFDSSLWSPNLLLSESVFVCVFFFPCSFLLYMPFATKILKASLLHFLG